MQSNNDQIGRKTLIGIPPQPPLWQANPIQYLINDKFPLNYILKVQHLSPDAPKLDEQTVQEITEFRKELESKLPEELAPLVEDAKNREAERNRKYAEKLEAEALYNQPSADADFGYWSRISYWTLEEAVALSLAKNPKIVNFEKLRQRKGNSPFIASYNARFEEVRRAKVMGQLWDSTVPILFVSWAERVNFEMPLELVERIKKLGTHVMDWRKAYDSKDKETKELRSELEVANQKTLDAGKEHVEGLKNANAVIEKIVQDWKNIVAQRNQQIVKLTADIEELRTSTSKQSKATNNVPLPRERESFLKLVLGMAIGGYGYDPKATKSKQTKAIADDLRTNGISLDEDTVLKYLTEAKTELADKLT